MGDWKLSLPWLTLKPAWRARDQVFEARTRQALRYLTLFGYEQYLHIDSNRRVLRLRSRRFWHTVRDERIPFSRIRSIVYGYSGDVGEFAYIAKGADISDTVGNFRVGLLLHDAQNPLTLFVFSGGAAWAAELAAGVLHDELFDVDLEVSLEGTEEHDSREFLSVLRRYLGVPVRSGMQERVQAAIRAQEHPCPRCERPIMRSATKCTYCGSRFEHAPRNPD